MTEKEKNYDRIEKVKSLLWGAIYTLASCTGSRQKLLASTWGDLHLLTDKNYINAMPEEHLKDSLIKLNNLFLKGIDDTRVEKIINLIFDLHDKLSVRLWDLNVKYIKENKS